MKHLAASNRTNREKTENEIAMSWLAGGGRWLSNQPVTAGKRSQ